jgi:hypothetical protein
MIISKIVDFSCLTIISVKSARHVIDAQVMSEEEGHEDVEVHSLRQKNCAEFLL